MHFLRPNFSSTTQKKQLVNHSLFSKTFAIGYKPSLKMWKEGRGRKRVHTEGPFLEASREALHQSIVEDVIEWEVTRNYHSYGI
jgi:hypothetical protein